MSVLILEFINKNNSFNNKNKRNTNSTLCVILILSLIPASTHSNSKTIVNGKKSITTNRYSSSFQPGYEAIVKNTQ